MSRWAICAAVAVSQALAQPPANWSVARSRHFEVYSQQDQKTARTGLAWLEELRAFVVQQTGLNPDSGSPVRVIAFLSPHEYAPYRLQSLSDAYYVGSDVRQYLVLPALDAPGFGTAAHEYAHFLFHMAGLNLPPWLREGMAEVFSSVRIGSRGSTIGGELPARAQVLRHMAWMPLGQVLAWSGESPLRDNYDAVGLFYAQSWALTEMLALSPEYRQGFRSLVTAIASGVPSAQALARVYGKSIETIAADLHTRVIQHRTQAVPLDAGQPSRPSGSPDSSEVSPVEMRLILADVLLLAQEYDRAEELYRGLEREAPDRAEIPAGLGLIALAHNEPAQAQRLWSRAVAQGITDPAIGYRYALLLDRQGQSPAEERAVLELVVRLRPDFEDARFRLGLLEENAGRHEAALAQLTAIPSPAHAYHYWCAVAQALLGLDRNQEAADAAQKAVEHATGAEERVHALQFAYTARTHSAVQFMRDAQGRLILATTRVPNDAPAWNAFIEPGDDLRRVEGTLREVECGESGLRLRLEVQSGPITVSIPDPGHVLMRNGPAEFICGPQNPTTVQVEYAAKKTKETDGIARAITYTPRKPGD